MNFSLSVEQALFRDTVARYAGDGSVEARKAARRHPGGIDRNDWRALADLGLLTLDEPQDFAVIAETLGRGLAVAPWLECGYLPLRLLGDAAAATGIVDGSRLAAVAFAEPGRRYAPDSVAMKAVEGRGGWRLSGAKTFVLGGAAADLFLVTAATPDGSAVFAVEADTAERRPYAVIDGSIAAEVTLHESPATPIENADWPRARTEARLMASAEIVGLASRLFDDTLGYVRQRAQFGQPIGRFQAVQHRLVDAYAMLEQMRSTLIRAVLLQRGDGWQAEVAGAKAFIAERAIRIGEEAIQLHGGMGVTDDLAVGHAHKRVLLLSKLFGDLASDLATYTQFQFRNAA